MHLIEAALFDVDGVLAFPELLSQYKDLAIEPSHIVFFDDDAKNVAAARHTGMQAYVYESLDDVAQVMDGIAR